MLREMEGVSVGRVGVGWWGWGGQEGGHPPPLIHTPTAPPNQDPKGKREGC